VAGAIPAMMTSAVSGSSNNELPAPYSCVAPVVPLQLLQNWTAHIPGHE
jgi:hypothetical protein